MSRKGYAYTFLAALVVGFLIGFILGGMLIPEKEPTGNEKPATTVDYPRGSRPGSEEEVIPTTESSAPGAPDLRSAGMEITTLMKGTDWETQLYIIRGEQPEPKMLVLGGVHGDEPAAYWSGNAASDLRLKKGTLYVIPHLNEVARKKGTREGSGDINRKFPGNPAGDPEQRLCWEVTKLIQEEGIEMVMTFHEALGFRSEPPHHPGQTFYYDWDKNPYQGTDLTAKANQIIDRLNAKIRANLKDFQQKELFTTYVDPIPTSATFELMQKVHVDYAYGCEVCKNNDPKRRVWFHLAALTTWMELEGFTIINWPEVEANIWSGYYLAT